MILSRVAADGFTKVVWVNLREVNFGWADEVRRGCWSLMRVLLLLL